MLKHVLLPRTDTLDCYRVNQLAHELGYRFFVFSHRVYVRVDEHTYIDSGVFLAELEH